MYLIKLLICYALQTCGLIWLWFLIGLYQISGGGTPALWMPLVLLIPGTIAMGFVMRSHYSEYFYKSDPRPWTAKRKIRFTYGILLILEFIVSIAMAADRSEQGAGDYLARIMDCGLIKFLLVSAAVVVVGMLLVMGKCAFSDMLRGLKLQQYDSSDPLSEKKSRSLLTASDEELFPALMQNSPEARKNGSLTERYQEEVLAGRADALPEYGEGKKKFSSAEERESFITDYNLAIWHYWQDKVYGWLCAQLRHPERVDSFPAQYLLLDCKDTETTVRTMNASGYAKQAANEARSRAAKEAMSNWEDRRDNRERVMNELLSGRAQTEREEYLTGHMDAQDYLTSDMYRDMLRDRAQQKINDAYAGQSLDEDDFDISKFNLQDYFVLDYLEQIEDAIHSVERDAAGKDRSGADDREFYQLLWPVYVVAQNQLAKSDAYKALGAKVYSSGLGNNAKIRRAAAANFRELYRQMRFYLLWAPKSKAANKLKIILDCYIRTIVK